MTTKESAVIWDLCFLLACSVYSSTPEPVYSFEMSVKVYQTTQRLIQEDDTPYIRYCCVFKHIGCTTMHNNALPALTFKVPHFRTEYDNAVRMCLRKHRQFRY